MLARSAWNPETDELDLGELFPALRTYCPILYADVDGSPSIHDHPQQCLFLLLDCEEAFYGGAAGGGKSAALLAAALMYVDVPGYRAAILRRTYTQLSKGDALIPLSHEWLSGTDAKWNEQKKKWTFPAGATLEFGHVKDENAKYDYQGAAYHFLGFDELTQFPLSIYEYIAFSRQRRRVKMQQLGIPVRVRSAANPGNIGHGWVKRRFVLASEREPGAVYIPAKVRDNPGLDADDYERRLRKLSPTLASQLLDGDWDAFEGMAYPEWNPELHLVEPFDLPDNWLRLEGMDHGVTNPTAWLLIATDYDGNEIVADEYYAPGLPELHAPAILDLRAQWWEAKDEDRYPVRHPAYGDPASLRESLPIQNEMGHPLSLQEHYQGLGVRLIPANNRRKIGFIEIRSRLAPDPERRFPAWHPRAGQLGSPSLFVFAGNCPNLVEQLENAPLAAEENDPERGEAVDRRWESQHGHSHAALRYGLTARPQSSEEPTDEPDDPREAYMQARAQRRRNAADGKKTEPGDYVEL